ncbi:MAG: hypothetical protein C0483_21135 [Pirellula sp.]|nr:hypothetical protein [Pirellula sp.]
MLGNGRADDRRRRVLSEELKGGAAPADQASAETSSRSVTGSKARNRYGDAARMERQPRVVDLLPRHYGWIALVFFLGALGISALEAGYYYLPQLVQFSASGRIAALDLAGDGSLASWLSTALLTAAAVTAWVVYGVRKHRADDYHGRYRIWFLAASAWLFLGMDEAASLHEALRDLAVGLSGEHGIGHGSVWWLGVFGLVLGFVGLRLALEMRECRLSTTLLLACGLVYSAAAVVLLNGELNWFPQVAGIDAVMLEEGLTMTANLLLLTSQLVHARYVVLEAEGEISPRAAKAKKEKTPKTAAKSAKESSAKEPAAKEAKEPVVKIAAKAKAEEKAPAKGGGLFGWLRKTNNIDPPHAVPAPTRKTSDLTSVAKASNQVPASAFREVDDDESDRAASRVKRVRADFSESDDEDDDGPRDGRKLSKADRKALRRQKEAERRGYDE